MEKKKIRLRKVCCFDIISSWRKAIQSAFLYDGILYQVYGCPWNMLQIYCNTDPTLSSIFFVLVCSVHIFIIFLMSYSVQRGWKALSMTCRDIKEPMWDNLVAAYVWWSHEPRAHLSMCPNSPLPCLKGVTFQTHQKYCLLYRAVLIPPS